MRRWSAWAVVVAVILVSARVAAKAIPDRPAADRQPVGLTKPRVSPLDESQWTAVHKDLVARFSKGRPADNQLKTLLQVPEIVEGAMPMTIYLTDASTLTARHRDLLILRTAWLCGSQTLWATGAQRARERGLSADEIRRVAQGPVATGWTPFERNLLQAADELYRNSAVSDPVWRALAAEYDVLHLVDAVETVNHFTFLSLLYNSLGVQPDAGFKDRLPRDVAYRVNVPEPEPALKVARVEPQAGTGIAVSRTFARHPAMNAARGPRANFINRVSKLTPRHREMLILRIGWDCRSEYEWAQHVGTVGRARDHGVDPVKVAEGPDAPGIDPFDAAIYRATDELYQQAMVSDQSWAALSARFDTALMMSAVFTAASYRATSMSLKAYGVQLEPGDERFPQVANR
jgi:alkylhydroperoxidase family enzyme